MKNDEFKCARCGNICKKWLLDKKLISKGVFVKHTNCWNDGDIVVCNDCFYKISPLDHSEELK